MICKCDSKLSTHQKLVGLTEQIIKGYVSCVDVPKVAM
jgi:hypothetical protein